jgi:signal transduction histidine kinase
MGHGIGLVRHSLGLGPEEERLVHAAGDVLRPHVDGWVDRFVTRLLTDPAAAPILADEARAIRAKRGLTAWFHELFSLPYDEHYERLRERAGHKHLDVGMPPELLLTAMSGLRLDVLGTIGTAYAKAPPEEARAVARAVALALDMEHALMATAYRRRERTLDRQRARAVYGRRAATHFLHTLVDRVDAALCHLELARRDGPHRGAALQKAGDVLRNLARFDRRMREHGAVEAQPPRAVRLAELLERAIADVSLDTGTRVEASVQPAGLVARLVPEAVHQAVEELLQNAAVHAPGGCIRLTSRQEEPDQVVLEIADEGPGWEPEVEDFQDLIHRGRGLGLAFCELVAELHEGEIELFTAPGGGAGVRLRLRERVLPGGAPR